jgi:hypothetical protein
VAFGEGGGLQLASIMVTATVHGPCALLKGVLSSFASQVLTTHSKAATTSLVHATNTSIMVPPPPRA